MPDQAEAIGPRPWSEYVRGGRDHFDRVVRSFNVFGRNAVEMHRLVRSVETDFLSSMRLTADPGSLDTEGERFRTEFWGQLDQRLHNLVASAVAVVDHTRPLVDFYKHDRRFVDEWCSRSEIVAKSPPAMFLRRLRNYLLHYGMAPIAQTMSLGPPKLARDWDDLTIKLSGEGLLRYPDWNEAHRDFIRDFDGGPPLAKLTKEYADDMVSLYTWVFAQYAVLHPPGVPPAHLYPGRPVRD